MYYIFNIMFECSARSTNCTQLRWRIVIYRWSTSQHTCRIDQLYSLRVMKQKQLLWILPSWEDHTNAQAQSTWKMYLYQFVNNNYISRIHLFFLESVCVRATTAFVWIQNTTVPTTILPRVGGLEWMTELSTSYSSPRPSNTSSIIERRKHTTQHKAAKSDLKLITICLAWLLIVWWLLKDRCISRVSHEIAFLLPNTANINTMPRKEYRFVCHNHIVVVICHCAYGSFVLKWFIKLKIMSYVLL